jgi:hypothetical protein
MMQRAYVSRLGRKMLEIARLLKGMIDWDTATSRKFETEMSSCTVQAASKKVQTIACTHAAPQAGEGLECKFATSDSKDRTPSGSQRSDFMDVVFLPSIDLACCLIIVLREPLATHVVSLSECREYLLQDRALGKNGLSKYQGEADRHRHAILIDL